MSKQTRFVLAYLRGLCVYDAAQSAGLMGNPSMRAIRIAKRAAKLKEHEAQAVLSRVDKQIEALRWQIGDLMELKEAAKAVVLKQDDKSESVQT